MSDRIAVLNLGHCVQCDAPQTIFQRPRTRFVARFFRGCNVLNAEVADKNDRREIQLAGTRTALSAPAPGAEREVAVAIRGENVHVGPAAVGREVMLDALLTETVYRGLYSDYRLQLADGQRLSAMTGTRMEARTGDRVRVGVDAGDVIPLEEA